MTHILTASYSGFGSHGANSAYISVFPKHSLRMTFDTIFYITEPSLRLARVNSILATMAAKSSQPQAPMLAQAMGGLESLYTSSATQIKSLARTLVLSRQPDLQAGYVEIEEPDGNIISLGTPPPSKQLPNGAATPSLYPSGRLKIHSDFVWVRLVIAGEIGLSEGYMLGEVSSPDLTAFLTVFAMPANNPVSVWYRGIAYDTLNGMLSSIFRRVNDVTTARLNAVAHYSTSNEVFAAFLDPSMTYSCPLWLPNSDPAAATETLEEAQIRKYRFAISQARIKPTDHGTQFPGLSPIYQYHSPPLLIASLKARTSYRRVNTCQ
jgi:hypothetical protein